VRQETTDPLLPAILEGELDLAIVALRESARHLEAESLCVEPLLLAMPEDHPLFRRRRATVRHLASERFILPGEMHCLAERAEFLSGARVPSVHRLQVSVGLSGRRPGGGRGSPQPDDLLSTRAAACAGRVIRRALLDTFGERSIQRLPEPRAKRPKVRPGVGIWGGAP
jgi:DNA-binding transcriptional LysR family regulator